MGMRELLILVLGLAVLAIILRGLYVAIHARRGQIRLAIDRNIPQDVDLDELEMAELPRGGARVVQRSLHQVNRQNSLQNELDLDDEAVAQGPIPVLMDSVELRAGATDETKAGAPAESPYDPNDLDSLNDDHDLTDQPDDSRPRVQDLTDDDETDHQDERGTDQTGDQDDDWLDDDSEESPVARSDYDQEDNDASHESGLESDSFEDELDSFSMTAGERIGDPVTGGTARESRDSMFARFGRRVPGQRPGRDDPVPDEEEYTRDLYDDTDEEQQFESRRSRPPQGDFNGLQARSSEIRGSETRGKGGKESIASFNQARESRRPAGAVTPAATAKPRAVEPSEVLVINVMSHEDETFSGRELVQVLIAAGLRHGEMDIFHRHVQGEPDAPIVFSVANILNPGTFDLDNMAEFTTRGVSLFLAMSAAIGNREAFEQMLQTAQQIRGALNGELRDDHRNVMTSQTIAHYRQRIQDYELLRLRTAQAQS